MRALTEKNLIVDIVCRDNGSFLDIVKNGKLFVRRVSFNTYIHGAWLSKKGCDAKDILTGYSVNSRGWKSRNGSLKHASEDLTRLLIKKGII